VLEAGADDLRDDGDSWVVLTAPENFPTVLEGIQKANIPTVESAVAMVPKNTVAVDGKNVAGLIKLTDALEEHDDVQNVFSNADMDEKEMEALA
jgi:transcriptional/translational regulatory protein YebC/TACO1